MHASATIAAHVPFEPKVVAASRGKLQVILLAIGSALGLTTMRTMGTIEQIAAKYFAG